MKKEKKQMGNPDFKKPLKSLLEEVKKYVDLQLEYNKVAYREKTSEMAGQLILLLMLFGVFVFVMMFLSFAFVNWYATLGGGTRMTGFLWVTAFYLLMALLIYAFREPLIFSRLRKILGKQLSSTEEKQFRGGTGFADDKMTEKYLEHLKDKNRKQESSIRQQFQVVNESFSLINLTKAAIHTGIQAFITTRNVIQTAFQLTQKLKSKHKKKKQLEEE
jgi:Na+(H+)/acetate symporter ActP